MSIYSALIHIHSGLRWLVLLFILSVIISSVYQLLKSSYSGKCGNAMNRFALLFTHLQFLVGLILYFTSEKVRFEAASMKESLFRFYLVEHIALMVIAIILITIGYFKAKNTSDERKKHKALVIYFSIALILILAAIPWPFRGLGAGWF
jgi:hypothetical protein